MIVWFSSAMNWLYDQPFFTQLSVWAFVFFLTLYAIVHLAKWWRSK